jgi:hypothetical protein
MGDTDRCLLQQFQLRRLLDDDRVTGNRPDLFRVELITDGKHQLQTFVPPDGSGNGAEDLRPAIHQCTHGSIDQRLSR